ncbi:MAG: cytochrome P460 family protein [Deltaproteobacteria bacterium]|jgi:hypothetical protein|nr:cytochrome P460 family protein [Deltaproteobacteria bacterium]MBW2520011.1 cytochrome P460 family protein [Deltaproteobacteria bacterium]
MKCTVIFSFLVVCFLGTTHVAEAVQPAPNGIAFPEDYKDWRLVSSSHRIDNNTLRVIVGNDKAIEAVRTNKINPWPDGAMLGKMVWKETILPSWEKAVVPGEFVHVEFMIKDSNKYPDTGGWGFARWKGLQLEPHGQNESFVFECFGCHTPVKDSDYVFTHPSTMP